MKQRLQRSRFSCCSSSANGKIIYPTLKPKLNATKRMKSKAPNSATQCEQEPVEMKTL